MKIQNNRGIQTINNKEKNFFFCFKENEENKINDFNEINFFNGNNIYKL